MIQTIINLFRRPKPQPFKDLPPITVDLIRSAQREIDFALSIEAVKAEMERREETPKPKQLSFEEFRKERRSRPGGRKWNFHDMEIGETRRLPLRARSAVRKYGQETGKKWTTKQRNNGLWIKRIA